MENNYKKGSFLDHLTKGLYDAVVQAQSLAENQHIEALNKFFDKDGNPLCLDIKIPDDKGQNQVVSVPLATLAPQSSINADLGASILPKRNQYATLKVTFEGTDPPEGLVRLNNNLIKQIP